MRTKESCVAMKNGNRDSWAKELKGKIRGRFTSIQAAMLWNVEASTARFRLRALIRRGDVGVVEGATRWDYKIFCFTD